MRVIDASVAVKWFVEEQGRDSAMDIIRSGEPLVAPDIVVFEVLNVLRRKQRQRLIEAKQVFDAMDTMTVCFSRLVPSTTLAEVSMKLSIELDHSVYDCAYLACAGLFDAPFVTADRVFAAKALAVKPDCPIRMLGSR